MILFHLYCHHVCVCSYIHQYALYLPNQQYFSALPQDQQEKIMDTKLTIDMLVELPNYHLIHKVLFLHIHYKQIPHLFLLQLNQFLIDVPYTDAIPSDYEGVMGVPITFMDKYWSTSFRFLHL